MCLIKYIFFLIFKLEITSTLYVCNMMPRDHISCVDSVTRARVSYLLYVFGFAP